MSVSMGSHISLEHFTQTAQRAVRDGRFLDVNKNNELVLKGTTWLGRQVQHFKEHFFPRKVREQNQRVLNALRQTLRKEVGSDASSRVSLNVSWNAKDFAKDIAKAAAQNQTHVLRRQGEGMRTVLRQPAEQSEQQIVNRHRARQAAHAYFERQKGLYEQHSERMFRDLPPKEAALKRYVMTLNPQEQQLFKTRYTHLLESMVSDKTVTQTGQIPGGSNQVYPGAGSHRLGRAAFLLTAEAAYKKEYGQLPKAGDKDPAHYGLGSKEEVAWVRQKLSAVGDKPLEPLPQLRPEESSFVPLSEQVRSAVPMSSGATPTHSLSGVRAAIHMDREQELYQREGEAMFTGLSPGEAASRRYVVSLDDAGKEVFRARYLALVEAIGKDPEFARASQIPGGSRTPYIEQGNINGQLIESAYQITADEARGGVAHGYLYGLRNEEEVAWVRQKLGEI